MQDVEVNGARLFNHHPKMDRGKFIFRNCVFNHCLLIEDCFCGISFYSCQFNNCIFLMPAFSNAQSRHCMRRCTYTNAVLLARQAGGDLATRAEFLRTARVAGGEGNGTVVITRTLAQAIARLPPGPQLLYNANTPLKSPY